MKKIIYIVDIIAYSLLTLAMAVMVISIFLQVFFRYVMDHPLFWSEEVGRYAFIWLVFIGAAIATKRGAHIGVDYFTSLLSHNSKRILGIFVTVLLLIFMGIVIIASIPLIQNNMTQKSPAVRITMGYIFLAIPIGFSMMFIYTLNGFIKALKTKPLLPLSEEISK